MWRWLFPSDEDVSRTAAITQLLKRHASENRLRVLHPVSDGREKYTPWQRMKHQYEAKARRRR